MFAEELGSNASRKRAQDNKARRRRVKEHQKAKEQASAQQRAQRTSVTRASGSTASTVTPPPTKQPRQRGTTASTTTRSSCSNSGGTRAKTVVEQAAAQRQVRAAAAARIRSAIRIQAWMRGSRFRWSYESQLTQRVSTLHNTHCPSADSPGAAVPLETASELLVQFHCVQSFIIKKYDCASSRGNVFAKLLECVVLPGLAPGAEANIVLAHWITSGHDYRLQVFLKNLLGYWNLSGTQTCLHLLLHDTQSSSSPSAKHLLGERCRSYLFQSEKPELDWMLALRRALLGMHKSPIPPEAHDATVFSRKLSWDESVLEAMSRTKNGQAAQSRFVTSVLTIPLLHWRLSPAAVQALAKTNSQQKPLLISMLESFTIEYARRLDDGEVDDILSCEDLPLTACPAMASQRLFANLVQFGRHLTQSVVYFKVIALLLTAIPVTTFSDSTTNVHWIPNISKPIVLSPVIMEHCQGFFLDSYFRRLVMSSIGGNMEAYTDAVLAAKTDEDRKHDVQIGTSATAMAAEEARVQRKNFWRSSAWGQKLAQGVSSMLMSSESKKISGKVSRDGGKTRENNFQNDSRNMCTVDLLYSLLRIVAIILARWGGTGNDDVITGSRDRRQVARATDATRARTPCVTSLLNVLCFSTPIVRVLWGVIQSDDGIHSDVLSLVNSKNSIRCMDVSPKFESSKGGASYGAILLQVFLFTFSHVLVVTDDVELHEMNRPLPLHQVRRCIILLKKILYNALSLESNTHAISMGPSASMNQYFGLSLITAMSRTMKDLYDRSSRQPLCAPNLWIIAGLMENQIGNCKSFDDYQNMLSKSTLLRLCPYMVSFKIRLKLFERIVTTSRIEAQGENSSNPFHSNPLKPGIPVRISRGRLLEDGLLTMNNLGSNMRQRISVQYFNEAGTRETGIDAGGLFKEFWTDLCAIAFDPNYALFCVTDSNSAAVGVGNCLYPNPSSAAAHGVSHLTLFAFLGRILGKALYEGITIHPRFAHFFLSFLKGDYNFLHMLPDLGTVEPELFKNLMFLKTYDGDARDLCLTFTVSRDEFGRKRDVSLVPGGAEIDVTNANKHFYISRVAKYYVYDRIRDQSEAMVKGLFEVLDQSWLRLFNEPELQILICGAIDGIDVDDLKANCQYTGGFTSLDRTVKRFWKVVASLTEKQQGALLRFITSCERPPPLGFASMNPPLTIQRVGIYRDGDRLPSASTCFNVLKLPTYSSEKVLKDRLIYAIESGSGFELT